MSDSRDIALGLAVVGTEIGMARRVAADLAHHGRLARGRLDTRTDELTEAVAHVLAKRHVVELVATEVLAVTDLDAVVEAVLEHERTQQALERALLSPGLERLLVQVLESRLVDELTERVLASPELERVVEFVATSPQVLDVVTRQTQSLAGDMADGVRARAHSIDDVAERTVRGWLRRPRPQMG